MVNKKENKIVNKTLNNKYTSKSFESIKHIDEYGILTNEIYKSWFGMKANEYKKFKGLRTESLRDNMTDIEVALTDLGEIATRELAKEHKPYGLKQNKEIAKRGGNIVKITKDSLEKELGRTVITENINLHSVENT